LNKGSVAEDGDWRDGVFVRKLYNAVLDNQLLIKR